MLSHLSLVGRGRTNLGLARDWIHINWVRSEVGEGVYDNRLSECPSPGALRAPTSPHRGEVDSRRVIPVHVRLSVLSSRAAAS